MNTNEKTGMASGSQMRINEIEREIIKRTFSGNDALLLILRKIFLPEIDPKAPIGGVIDLWMTLDIKDMSLEQQVINLKARNTLITHVDQQLMQLKMIAAMETPTPEDVKAKVVANSNK